MQRSKALQIYMKPGLREDDLMLRVWEASRRHARPQDIFRSMLRAGLRAMVESGELSDAVIEECGLDAIFENRRMRAARRRQTVPEFVPAAAPLPAAHVPVPGYTPEYHPAYHAPMPPAFVAPAAPTPQAPVAVAEPPRPTAPPPKVAQPSPREDDPDRPRAAAEDRASENKGATDGKRIGRLM